MFPREVVENERVQGQSGWGPEKLDQGRCT